MLSLVERTVVCFSAALTSEMCRVRREVHGRKCDILDVPLTMSREQSPGIRRVIALNTWRKRKYLRGSE